MASEDGDPVICLNSTTHVVKVERIGVDRVG